MKKLPVVIMAILAVLALAFGCAKEESTAPAVVSTPSTVATTPSMPTPAVATPSTTAKPVAATTQSPTTPATFEVSGTAEQSGEETDRSETTENGKIVIKATAYNALSGSLEGEMVSRYTMEVNPATGELSPW
jgi:hypothetical protein